MNSKVSSSCYFSLALILCLFIRWAYAVLPLFGAGAVWIETQRWRSCVCLQGSSYPAGEQKGQ